MDPTLDDPTLQEALDCFDWSRLVFKDDRIYTHKIMRIKYETYDARKDEDIIHLDTDQSNVMFLNPAHSLESASHPFSYGKVIAILHADVSFAGDLGPRRGVDYVFYPMEVLWVRWYRVHPSTEDRKLDEAELLEIDQPDSHGFVDPLRVLRACHLIPKFSQGLRYEDGEGKSAIASDSSDWERYFINRYENFTLRAGNEP